MRVHAQPQTAGPVLPTRPSRLDAEEQLRLRVHGDADRPTLIHLPGLHGDWTLLGPFRSALGGQARLVECTYPRRPDWQLADYAGAVEAALLDLGIHRGWILGESFSSQVAWQLLAHQQECRSQAGFQPDGVILVGGFVRHPWLWGVRLAHSASRAVPLWLLRRLCQLYGRAASRQYCDRPEVLAELNEFVERRANEPDRQAINRRYRLIAESDFRPVARLVHLPVFHLSGGIDPIVPWWHVRPWLRRHCPGYRASQIFWRAGHNVLLSAPARSAQEILGWIGHTAC